MESTTGFDVCQKCVDKLCDHCATIVAQCSCTFDGKAFLNGLYSLDELTEIIQDLENDKLRKLKLYP